jgi:hypothetical protein
MTAHDPTTPNPTTTSARPNTQPPVANTPPLSPTQGAVAVHDQRGTAQKKYHHPSQNSSTVL